MGKSENLRTETKPLMVLLVFGLGPGVGRALGMAQPVKDTIWPVKGTLWPLRHCRGSVQALIVPIPAQTQH